MAADHSIYQPYRFSKLAKAAQSRAASATKTKLHSQHDSDGSDLLLTDLPKLMAAINRFTVMINAWNDHGRQIFDMTEPMQAFAGKAVSAPASIPDNGYPEAFYVHFGQSAGLNTSSGDFIDGALVTLDNKSEKRTLNCAFACGSDKAPNPDGASLAQILRTQARLAFATAPVENLSAITLSQDVGDPMVFCDKMMSETVARLLLALSYLAEPALDESLSDEDEGFELKPF